MKGLLLTGFMMMCGVASAAPGGVLGNWATPEGGVVRVAPCGQELCLTVVKVDAKAPVTTDTKNPDASLRGQPICGMKIGSGFRAEGENAASGGHVYDPKSGKTYSGKFWLQGEKLHLRGYVGVSLFGRSEVWTRTGEVGACR